VSTIGSSGVVGTKVDNGSSCHIGSLQRSIPEPVKMPRCPRRSGRKDTRDAARRGHPREDGYRTVGHIALEGNGRDKISRCPMTGLSLRRGYRQGPGIHIGLDGRQPSFVGEVINPRSLSCVRSMVPGSDPTPRDRHGCRTRRDVGAAERGLPANTGVGQSSSCRGRRGGPQVWR